MDNKKERIIDIGDWLIKQTLFAFQLIGQELSQDSSNLPDRFTLTIGDKNYTVDRKGKVVTGADIENLTKSNFANSLTKGEESMQRIKKIKNARIRVDGRFEWRKMISGHTYQIIEKDFEKFSKKIRKAKTLIKQNKPIISENEKANQSLYEIALLYYKRNIESKVDRGTLSKGSALRYEDALKKLAIFTLPIKDYTKDTIIDFFNNTKQHRTGSYCYFLLRRVFADEFEKGNIKRNPIATMENPYPPKRCSQSGDWLNPSEQQILKDNIKDDSIIGKEILFYVITGCRLIEAYDAQIDFDKAILRIMRHKTRYSGVKYTTMPLSPQFCEIIKPVWHNMFKTSPKLLSKNITRYLNKIGINDKSANDLRHTFSSNLYYLGVDPKLHQYLMGHRSIKLTYETYTTLDLAVNKNDIINIWGNLYPNYKKDDNL